MNADDEKMRVMVRNCSGSGGTFIKIEGDRPDLSIDIDGLDVSVRNKVVDAGEIESLRARNVRTRVEGAADIETQQRRKLFNGWRPKS